MVARALWKKLNIGTGMRPKLWNCGSSGWVLCVDGWVGMVGKSSETYSYTPMTSALQNCIVNVAFYNLHKGEQVDMSYFVFFV